MMVRNTDGLRRALQTWFGVEAEPPQARTGPSATPNRQTGWRCA
jgi:hypothetical protein